MKSKFVIIFFWLSFVPHSGLYAEDKKQEEVVESKISERKLTLQEAIQLGLSSNPDLLVLKISPKIAKEDIREAKGMLDTNLVLSGSVGRDVSPSSSSLIGTELLTSDKRFGASVDKKTTIGTSLGVSWENSRVKDSSPFTSLNPEWRSELSLNLVQPLLKGTWGGRPGILIKIRKDLGDAANWDYRTSLADKIREIIRAYWSVKLSERELFVKEKSLNLARKLKDEAHTAVSIGLQAPIVEVEADSQVALRQEELLAARNLFSTSKNELTRQIGGDLSQSIPLVIDEPEVRAIDFNDNESVDKALTERPEIKAQKARIAALQKSKRFAQNSLLPEVNVVGKTGVSGLAGTVIPNSNDPGFGSNDDFSKFEGGYRDSLDILDNGDYYSYEAGIEIRHPLENRTNRARYNKSIFELDREVFKLRSLEQLIAVEVRNGIGDVRTAIQRVKASEESIKFAFKSLETGTERFKVGMSTSREILELQKDMSESESANSRALVDFQLALADFYRSRGELLEQYNVAVVE